MRILILCFAAALAAHAQIRPVASVRAPNADGGDHFGNGGTLEGKGVALSWDGNTMVVGAPYESSAAKGINGDQKDNSLYSSGAVYVFTRSGDHWTPQAYIKASNPGQSDKFGHVVSLSQDGNTLAVSAYLEGSAAKGVNGNQNDDSIPGAGAVYVFARTGSTWTQQAYLKASNTGEAGKGEEPPDGDQFGFSMALSADGNTLAVGAISEDSGAKGVNGDQSDNSRQSSGAVYVFTRAGGRWSQQAYIKASNTDPNDLFGYAVALSSDGNTLAASAFDEDSSARTINGPQDTGRRGSGAVYVFTRSGAAWSQQAFLKASNAEAADSLGYDVAISADGNTIVAGAADEDCVTPGVNPAGCDGDRETDLSIGAAYIFVRTNGQWSQQALLKASNPGKEDWFGSRVAISGDGTMAAISAQLENGGSKGINGPENDDAEDAGAVYLFTRSGAAWRQTAYVKSSNAPAYAEFGSAVAFNRDGSLMAVGARSEGSGDAIESGAVYVFRTR
jgi:hypothetical protein